MRLFLLKNHRAKDFEEELVKDAELLEKELEKDLVSVEKEVEKEIIFVEKEVEKDIMKVCAIYWFLSQANLTTHGSPFILLSA